MTFQRKFAELNIDFKANTGSSSKPKPSLESAPISNARHIRYSRDIRHRWCFRIGDETAKAIMVSHATPTASDQTISLSIKVGIKTKKNAIKKSIDTYLGTLTHTSSRDNTDDSFHHNIRFTRFTTRPGQNSFSVSLKKLENFSLYFPHHQC